MAKISDMYNEKRVILADVIPLNTPFVIQIEPSGYCNLRCSFCPVNDENVQQFLKKDIMTMETFKKFVDQCKCFADRIKILRVIGAGEPLLNKNLPKMIGYAKQSGAFEKIEITTNGTLLTPALSDMLLGAGLDILKISLEAVDNDDFFRISGVRVDIDQIFENIKYFFLHRNNSILYVKTTNISLSDDKSKDRFFKKYGDICDYIFIENVAPIWPEYESNEMNGHITRYGRSGGKIDSICVQPFKLLSIAADGEVLPCCADWKRKLSLGNINNTPIKEIWNGEELLRLRLNLLKGNMSGSPCAVCKFQQASQNDSIDDKRNEIYVKLEKYGEQINNA